ncbi:MAG: hypothetical protein FWG64_06095 [Firmicutes bacterium]|nr:hypothetical protein [Bacillota bacterium]
MTDRIIQQSILQVLEPICEAKFHLSADRQANTVTDFVLTEQYHTLLQEYNH